MKSPPRPIKRKLTEDPLRASEKRYRSLFDNMLNGVAHVQLIFDGARVVDFLYLTVNPAFETLTGSTNAVGKRASKLTPATRGSAPWSLETLGRVARTGAPERFEYGSEATKERYGGSVYGLGPDQVISVFDVIANRPEAEQALRASEEKYRELFEYTSNGVAVYRAIGDAEDFEFVAFSRAAEQIERTERKSVIGKRVTEVFPGVKEFGAFSVFQRVWRTGKPEYFPPAIYQDQRDPGTWREAWVYRLTSGEIVAVYSNVTDRIQAEQTLRASEARLRLSVQSANIGLWDWDLATDAVYFSPEWKTQIGYGDDEIPGRFEEWRSRVHPDDLEATLRKLRRFLENPQRRHRAEYRFRHKDGSYRWIDAQGDVLRDAAGKAVRMLGCHIDITERKQAEEALRASEARLRLSVRSANIGLWDWDLATDAVYFSPEWKSQIGYAEDEVPPRFEEWRSRVNPDDLEPTMQKVRAFIDNPQGRHQAEFRFRHKNGSFRWIEAQGDVLRDAAGKPVRMLGCHIDITERKQAEEARRASEANYRSLFDNMLNGVVSIRLIFDGDLLADLEYMEVNRAFPILTGLTNVVGKRVSEISPDLRESNPELFESFARVARSGVAERYEFWSGVMKQWYSTSVYRRGPNEVVIVFDVITQRKQAEEALRASEANYRSLFESASDAIIVADAQGRYIDVNPAACRLFGATRDQLLEHNLHDLAAEETPDHAPLIARLISGEVSKGECRSRRKDGSLFFCECTAAVLPDRRLLAIVRDITERKKAEEALRGLSGRLFTLEDDERRRLARELHDSTSQSLAALLMNLSIVSESIEVSNQHARAALAESAALAHQCLREIRTLSYILHPPDLDELGLESALSRYIEGFTQRSGIGVELTVSAGLGRFPQAVETTVFRVVQECLTNIHRHSGSSQARLRLTRGPSNLVLEVEDAGQGIHNDAPSGVGIASMRERVRQLNGWLEVTSGPGGTIVTATIPL